MAETQEEWEKKTLRFFLFMLAFGLIVVAPPMLLRYAARTSLLGIRFALGLPGRPFGKKWFAVTRHVVWQTNFLRMPPDDDELARWLAAEPDVAAALVRREPYWVIFDCVFVGYFLDPGLLKIASVRKAQSLGYDTGGRIAIIDIKE